MSAFLGPIHFWLYNKIQLQQDIVEDMIKLGETVGIADLKQTLDEKYGVSERRPLEEVIDEMNIHGWLQGQVSQVEYKLAECVKALLAQDAANMESLKTLFFKRGEAVGSKLAQTEGLNLEMIYKGISDSLLDGMPCDHAIRIVSQDEQEIVWERMTCVHERYWQEVGEAIHHYYALREEWLKGLAHAVGVKFVKRDERTYSMSTK
nr:hypothetical protein [uncultured Cellulosilyticum sp.]